MKTAPRLYKLYMCREGVLPRSMWRTFWPHDLGEDGLNIWFPCAGSDSRSRRLWFGGLGRLPTCCDVIVAMASTRGGSPPLQVTFPPSPEEARWWKIRFTALLKRLFLCAVFILKMEYSCILGTKWVWTTTRKRLNDLYLEPLYWCLPSDLCIFIPFTVISCQFVWKLHYNNEVRSLYVVFMAEALTGSHWKPKKCIPTRHNFPVFCRESADLVALCRFTQIPTTCIPTVASCLWLHVCIYSKTAVLSSSNPAFCPLAFCLWRFWSWHSVISPAEGASWYDDDVTPTKSKGAFYIINLTINH